MRFINYNKLLVPAKFIENFPMLIVACLLIVMGVSGTWVSFPLSGEIGLKELVESDIYSQVKWLLLALLALYCLSTVLKFFVVRAVLSVGVVCLLAYLALFYSFFNGENIWQYTQESKAFRDIQHVLALNETPNAGRSVETALAFDSFKFVDRIKVALGLLGWGAKLAILCAMLLWAYSIIRSQKVIFTSLLSSCLFAMFLLVSGVGDVALAYLKVNKGLRDFSQTTKANAMAQFDEAVLIDPALSYSVGFPLLTSYVYFSTYGPEHQNAYAYRINQELVAGEFSAVFALNSYIKNGNEITSGRRAFLGGNPPHQDAIKRVERLLVSNAYNRVGLLYLWHEEWAQAEQHFLMASILSQSMVAKVALLNIYNKTKQYASCNTLAAELLNQIENSSMSADIWTTKGECLSASGYPSEARVAFENSIKLDADKNYRAVKGLSGT